MYSMKEDNRAFLKTAKFAQCSHGVRSTRREKSLCSLHVNIIKQETSYEKSKYVHREKKSP